LGAHAHSPSLLAVGSAYGAGLNSIITQLAKAGVAVVVGVYAFAYNTMVRAKAKHGAELPVCGSDGIHSGPNGGLDFAYAFLKTLGIDGYQEMITIDCKAGKAIVTGGHTVPKTDGTTGTLGLESTTYPFCFTVRDKDVGDSKEQQQAQTVLAFLPFNKELNRLILKVKKGEIRRETTGEYGKLRDFGRLCKGAFSARRPSTNSRHSVGH